MSDVCTVRSKLVEQTKTKQMAHRPTKERTNHTAPLGESLELCKANKRVDMVGLGGTYRKVDAGDEHGPEAATHDAHSVQWHCDLSHPIALSYLPGSSTNHGQIRDEITKNRVSLADILNCRASLCPRQKCNNFDVKSLERATLILGRMKR